MFWDPSAALQNVENDRDELAHLLAIWLRESDRLLESMEESLQRGVVGDFRLAAHTLKGSLQILFADALAERAQVLEDGDDLKAAGTLLPDFANDVRALNASVEAYLANADA